MKAGNIGVGVLVDMRNDDDSTDDKDKEIDINGQLLVVEVMICPFEATTKRFKVKQSNCSFSPSFSKGNIVEARVISIYDKEVHKEAVFALPSLASSLLDNGFSYSICIT